VPDLKISLITVTYNAESTITNCIASVIRQNYKNVEYIIIDGGSTDGTIPVINQFKEHINILLSEPDKGIYDAMNKGINLATGDVIGTLNADDVFAGDDVLSAVAEAFAVEGTEITYGDLNYVKPDGSIVRKWRSGTYSYGMFNWGWMPPHPTFYCRKNLFKKFGLYSLNHGTAADYELMLRFIHLNKVNAVYVKKVMNEMNVGGVSNKSYSNRVKGLLFDYKAMRKNGISLPVITLIFKPLRKVIQFFS